MEIERKFLIAEDGKNHSTDNLLRIYGTLGELRQNVLERGVPIHESQGQKIYKAVDRLKKALRKAGHKKTRNEAPTVSQDLLSSVDRPNISADDRQSKSTVPYPKIDYSNYIIE